MSINVNPAQLSSAANKLANALNAYDSMVKNICADSKKKAKSAVPQRSVSAVQKKIAEADKLRENYGARVRAHAKFLKETSSDYSTIEAQLTDSASKLPRKW